MLTANGCWCLNIHIWCRKIENSSVFVMCFLWLNLPPHVRPESWSEDELSPAHSQIVCLSEQKSDLVAELARWCYSGYVLSLWFRSRLLFASVFSSVAAAILIVSRLYFFFLQMNFKVACSIVVFSILYLVFSVLYFDLWLQTSSLLFLWCGAVDVFWRSWFMWSDSTCSQFTFFFKSKHFCCRFFDPLSRASFRIRHGL